MREPITISLNKEDADLLKAVVDRKTWNNRKIFMLGVAQLLDPNGPMPDVINNT